MNAFAASHLSFIAAHVADVGLAAFGLNNNANNNTRHYGWAGV
ncbi:hypothetical protein [Dyella mobilis]|nr:hypothetical protein [Dyella mobilis]